MRPLPDQPFTTKDFSLRGGGIDFLGLRWVNLTMVGRDLIPELNNVTTDMGTFFLGAWIPWKFRQLCTNERDYTEKNYKAFREKVEVAFSLALRDELELPREFGLTRNRVGITQKCVLPCRLTFKDAKRKEQNSLYAAAIYGPALNVLGLVKAYHSLARQGARALNVPVPGDDPDTLAIVGGVDRSLRRSSAYQLLASLESPEFKGRDILTLAKAGLDPAQYRDPAYKALKACFRRKLLPSTPANPSFARTLTTQLILTTLRQREGLSTKQLRGIWYTGIFENGRRLRLTETAIVEHAQCWSCFMARQHQRYAIELFLWCFEYAIRRGNRSIEDVIEFWSQRSESAGLKLEGTFQDLARKVSGALFQADEAATSRAWNTKVDADDGRFEHVAEPLGDEAVVHGLNMFAGWYWRILVRLQDEKLKPLMALGGADRMSMSWFFRWLTDRRRLPIRELLKDIFSGLVFSQHMRIALARFDGTAQRLRFLIGDSGIEPTVSAREDLGGRGLPWMQDRLDTLVALLCDCDVLAKNGESVFLGSAASTVEVTPQ
jgi:hypothetical protein